MKTQNIGDEVVDRETEQGFTPGPWSISYDEPRPWNPERSPRYIVGADGEPLTVCGVGVTSWGNSEIDANARLIAAAPALYEASKEALRYIQYDPVLDDDGIAIVAQLRAALEAVECLSINNRPDDGQASLK